MPELNIIGATEDNRYFPYQKSFRVSRQSFWQAGQDSFTNPPAQNPDLFQSLTNAEPVLQGDIQRRRGYTLLTSITPTSKFNEAYSYRNELTDIHRLIWTSASAVVATDEAGGLWSNPLFTPSLTAEAVRMVLSRSYGYFADGVAADYLKWDGVSAAGHLTNWGIAVSSVAASISGPNPPGTAASVNITSGNSPWASPNNIKVNDGSFSTSTPVTFPTGTPAQSATEQLWATNFSLAISPSTDLITGIQVDVIGLQSQQTVSPDTAEIFAFLIVNGVVTGSGKPLTLPLASGTISFGGPTDAWGQHLTGVDVNASNFGVMIEAQSINDDGLLIGNVTYSLDFVQITAFSSGSTIILGSPSSGGITLLSGRVYTVAFTNSTAGTVSTIVPFSSTTGPLTTNDQPLSGLPVSSDPQVDLKLLLATADGGDETTLYLLATLPNVTTTYTDNMADTQLLLQPIFQQSDQNGNLHGVVNNLPPPLLNFPIKHKGRIFGTVGPTLYFSKNLDDVTTSTGTITSKWEEAWPATYSLDVSELAETVSGLLSDGQTLYIGSDASVRRLIGDSPDNFQEPEVIFNDAGVINQEVWKIVFSEGQPVGSMWLTPDSRVMFSDFNSYQDVGTPIQNVLNSVNRAVVQSVSHACAVLEGPAEYYMLYIPTGSATTPNTVCVYNMRTKKWVIWNPTDSPTASLFNITATGTPQWLFASQIGNTYLWNSATTLDRSGNTPVMYPVTLQSSWLDFGDPGLTKSLNKLVLDSSDPLLTLSINSATTVSSILNGTTKNILPTTPITQEAFGDTFVPMLGAVGGFRWSQYTFTSPASTTKSVLSSFDIEVMPSMRI